VHLAIARDARCGITREVELRSAYATGAEMLTLRRSRQAHNL